MMIATVCTFLLLWAMAFGSYALFNKGLAAKALRQQAIRYAVAAAVAVVPVAVAQAAPWQPRLLSVMLCSVAWMTAYPLTYHLTHRRTSPGYDLRIDQAFGLYTYALLSSLSLLAASLWPTSAVAGGAVGVLVFAALFLPLFLGVWYLLFHACIDADGMNLMVETNYNEMIEFVRSYSLTTVLSVVLGVAAVLCGCVWVNAAQTVSSLVPCPALQPWQQALLSLTAVAAGVYLFKPRHGLLVRTGIVGLYLDVRDYARQNERYRTEQQQRLRSLDVAPLAADTADRRPGLWLMVIGESASRDYMSAFRPQQVDSTPWLRQMKADSTHFILFPHAYSCASQTVPALERALTEYNQYGEGAFFSSNSIVDIAHRLGMKVHWYSNQGHLGEADTPTTLVAETADVTKWTRQELNKPQYDGELLSFLDDVDPTRDTLVVMHLMGSHFNFENRFPPSERQWEKTDADDYITDYLNSLHYTDSVLRQMFEKCRSRHNLQAMLYFSDHACVPDRHRVPYFDGYSHMHIPMAVYLSDDYRSRHPRRYAALRSHADSYFTNDLVYELMCGLFDIRSNHFNEEDCIASQAYRHTKDTLLTYCGQARIRDDKS